MSTQTVRIGTAGLTLDDVIAVARKGARIELTQDALAAMADTRAHIEELAAGDLEVHAA